MDPILAAQALRLIAQNIDLEQSPSLSEISSDLEQILGHVEAGNAGDARVASHDRVAGPIDFVKGLKRKVFDTKGVKKILDRIDRLNDLMKWCGPVLKKVRKGNDLADIASDEDFLQVFEGAAEFMTGGSDVLNSISEEGTDVGSALMELDEHWIENDEDEESDREIIENAISEFHSKCEEKVSVNEKKLKKQRVRQKGGKKLPTPKSKRKKPKAPPEAESDESDESDETPAKTPAKNPDKAKKRIPKPVKSED